MTTFPLDLEQKGGRKTLLAPTFPPHWDFAYWQSLLFNTFSGLPRKYFPIAISNSSFFFFLFFLLATTHFYKKKRKSDTGKDTGKTQTKAQIKTLYFFRFFSSCFLPFFSRFLPLSPSFAFFSLALKKKHHQIEHSMQNLFLFFLPLKLYTMYISLFPDMDLPRNRIGYLLRWQDGSFCENPNGRNIPRPIIVFPTWTYAHVAFA